MTEETKRMKIDGRCHCGAICYEADIDPNRVIICHCEDCQANSGAPYRANVPALMGNFRILRGEPKRYVKTAASGTKAAICFCGECGSALFSSRLENPQFVNLRLGAVKQRAELVPKAQYWCRSAMPWAFDIADIPRAEDQSQAPRRMPR